MLLDLVLQEQIINCFYRSSTSLKKVPLPKRHLDSFGGYEYTMGAKRGLILHTDRYQVRMMTFKYDKRIIKLTRSITIKIYVVLSLRILIYYYNFFL